MALQLERQHAIVLEDTIERVFPLFTPEGEREWVASWEPEYLHPVDGKTQKDMVFRTRHNDEESLWSCVLWEPARYHVRYARVTPQSRFGFVEITCRALGPRRTKATVRYDYTALTEAGEAMLTALDQTRFEAMIDEWTGLINTCLARDTVRAG